MIKKFLFSLLAVFCTVSIYAGEYTIDFTGKAGTWTTAGGEVTAKVNGSSISSSSTYCKITKGETITLSSVSQYITSVTYTVDSEKNGKENTMTVDAGTIDQTNQSWTDGGAGNICSFTITNGTDKSGGDWRLKSMTITTTAKAIDSERFASLTYNGSPVYDASMSGTTITINSKTAIQPADGAYKVVKHVTYKDGAEEDVNVDLSFSLDATANEWKSQEIDIYPMRYLVVIPYNNDPTLTLSSESVENTSMTSYGTLVGKVTLTGANLEDGNYYRIDPRNQNLIVLPSTFCVHDGKVMTPVYGEGGDITGYTEGQEVEFFISKTTKLGDINVDFKYAPATGDAITKTCEVVFERTAEQRTAEQTDVTASYTWDWTKAGTSVELSKYNETDPRYDDPYSSTNDFLLSNIAEVNDDDDFNSQALMVNCQWPVRNSAYYQGYTIKFYTTVPGKVKVYYSNTGSNGTRYVYVNDTKDSQAGSASSSATCESDDFAVNSGDVTISAKQFDGETITNEHAMLRISKVVFTVATDFSYELKKDDVTLVEGTDYTNTHSSIINYDTCILSAAYKTLTKPTNSEYKLVKTVKYEDDTTTTENINFKDFVLTDNRVYYVSEVNTGRNPLPTVRLGVPYGDPTAIDNVNVDVNVNKANAKSVKVMKNGQITIGDYNIAGQRVK